MYKWNDFQSDFARSGRKAQNSWAVIRTLFCPGYIGFTSKLNAAESEQIATTSSGRSCSWYTASRRPSGLGSVCGTRRGERAFQLESRSALENPPLFRWERGTWSAPSCPLERPPNRLIIWRMQFSKATRYPPKSEKTANSYWFHFATPHTPMSVKSLKRKSFLKMFGRYRSHPFTIVRTGGVCNEGTLIFSSHVYVRKIITNRYSNLSELQNLMHSVQRFWKNSSKC